MVKTAAEGKLTKAILEHFGREVKHSVLSDSSAARSIAQRVGRGKVKHLSLKQMWLQQAVREKELEVGKVDTLLNLADLGTKALEPSRMDSLMKQLPLERGLMAMLLIGSITIPSSGPQPPLKHEPPVERAEARKTPAGDEERRPS